MMRKGLLIAGGAALLATLYSGVAHADVLPTFLGATTISASVFRYDYQLTLQTNFRLDNGNTFTLFDFNGLLTGGANDPFFTKQPGSLLAGQYTASTQLTGVGSPGGGASDNPAAPNVVFTYSGGPTATVGTDTILGTISVFSQFPLSGTNATPYRAFSANAIGTADNGALLAGPNIGAPVPEAGTMGLLAAPMLGMLGMVAARRRRAK